jgi:hypothetical protein
LPQFLLVELQASAWEQLFVVAVQAPAHWGAGLLPSWRNPLIP